MNRRVTPRHARRVVMTASADDELLSTVLFLINRGYWLALYELYVDARRTNALEKDLPARNTLRSFFGDRERFPADVFRAVRDAFDSGVSAARVIEAESRAALAEYDLRLAREDAAAAAASGGGGGGGERTSRVDARAGVRDDDAFGEVVGDASETRSGASVDLDAKLDAATYDYLSRRGYKATALSMRDESSTAATLSESDDGEDGVHGALRRMYDRARLTETTAAALETERTRVEDVESALVRARARVDELERAEAAATSRADKFSSKLAIAEEELRALRASSATWERRAIEAESKATRLASQLGETGGDFSSNKGVPRSTIEEDDTLDACLTLIETLIPKISPGAKQDALPMISRACARACGNEARADRASNLFFELHKAPNQLQRDDIAKSIVSVGESIGMEAFDAMFARGCLGAEQTPSMNEERRILALDVLSELAATSWYTSPIFIVDGFRRASIDPSESVRSECVRAMSRFVEARRGGVDGGVADTLDNALMSLVTDGSDDVAESARTSLAPKMAAWYLGSDEPERFTEVLAKTILERANEALRGGWSGEAHDRVFSGWRSPEEGDRNRWHATSMMKTFEACCPAIRAALAASKPSSITAGVDEALSEENIPESWPLGRWCTERASDLIVDIISSTAPDVVGQESVRESICSAVTAWCGAIGAIATRGILIGKLNQACLVSADQRTAVLPILLAGVVPNTPDGVVVLGDYLKRLIRQAREESSDDVVDSARYLAAFQQHTEILLVALKDCAAVSAENSPTVRLVTARLLSATSEVLPLKHVVQDVYPTLDALRVDPESEVRREVPLALANIACTHYETIEPTTMTMRQLETLISDPDVQVRIAVVEALSLGAAAPGTSFAVSAANAIAAIAKIPNLEREITDAIFETTRIMLGADGDLFPQISGALVALVENADALDPARRAQAETMLRDGGWSRDDTHHQLQHPAASTPSTAPSASEPPGPRATLERGPSAYERMKSRARGALSVGRRHGRDKQSR